MSGKNKIAGIGGAWESGIQGGNESRTKAVDNDLIGKIDDSLELQMISIRLEKGLIESFKILGAFHGIGYQPLMRDAMKRFADSEMKSMVSGTAEPQKTQHHTKKTDSDHTVGTEKITA